LEFRKASNVGFHPIANREWLWNNRRPMKTKTNAPTIKISPRGNGPQSSKFTPIKKNGKTALSSTPDTHAPEDGARQSASLSTQEIAGRAYLRFQNRAAADGDHLADWLQAEAELASESVKA